jgi:hypothetical protein
MKVSAGSFLSEEFAIHVVWAICDINFLVVVEVGTCLLDGVCISFYTAPSILKAAKAH